MVPARDIGRDIACRVSGDGYMSRYDTWTWVRWEPLTIRLKPDDDAIAPGESNGYTLEISNPNPASLTLNELSATVPFPYVEGSSTGLSTADPAVEDSVHTWSGEFQIPAEGEASLHFRVAGTSDVGDYETAAAATSEDELVSAREFQGGRVAVEVPFNETSCTIRGTAGPDVLAGTAGNDVICGLGGDDRIAGGGGNDTLIGGAGNDRLAGDAGDDTLHGSDGADTLDGGLGADAMRGGGGRDTVNYADRTTRIEVKPEEDDDGFPPVYSDEGELEVPGEGDDVAVDIEIIRGGRANDELTGTVSDNELYGGPGDDLLIGGPGFDILDGGTGVDWLNASDSFADHVQCGAGLDTWQGEEFDLTSACEYQYRNES